MSTPGIVRVFEGDEEILCFSRHCDGYPDALGQEVRDFVAKKKIVNGISSRYDERKIANGAGCLAAQLVAFFKERVGGVYIHKPGGGMSDYGFEYHVKAPGYEAVDEASRADYQNFRGLPVEFRAFDCYRKGPKEIDVDKYGDEEDEEDDASSDTSSNPTEPK